MTSFIDPRYISAYVVHQTDQGPRYLLIRRCGKDLPRTWQMVTGGILENETAPEAALREIQEETGLTPQVLYSADAVETFYMQSIDKITSGPVFVAFVNEAKVQLSPSEHDAYEWLSYEEAKKRLFFAEQKRVFAHVHESCVLKKPDDFFLAVVNDSPVSKQKPIVSRTGVYGIVLQNEKLLLIKQQNGPYAGKFDLPGGGIEPGETIEEALRREFKEEVAMDFESMQLEENFSSRIESQDRNGNPYILHRIGLIYLVHGVIPLQNQMPEMKSFWIDPKELSEEMISPFVHSYIVATQKIENFVES